jgi:hypothetical protein
LLFCVHSTLNQWCTPDHRFFLHILRKRTLCQISVQSIWCRPMQKSTITLPSLQNTQSVSGLNEDPCEYRRGDHITTNQRASRLLQMWRYMHSPWILRYVTCGVVPSLKWLAYLK